MDYGLVFACPVGQPAMNRASWPDRFPPPVIMFLLWGFASFAMASAAISFAPYLPVPVMTAWRVVVGSGLALWFGVNLALAFGGPRVATPRLWAITVVGSGRSMWLAVLSVVWLFLPHGDTALQLGVIIFTLIFIVLIQIASTNLYKERRFIVLTTSASMAAVVILFEVALWPYIAPCLLVFGFAMVMLDANLRRTIEAMRAAQRAAEESRDARTRFLAAASHDLGQPLQSARLFLDQAQRSPDPAHRTAAGEQARNALVAMERLLNGMLEHLRLDADTVQPRPREMVASEVIAHVAAQFSPAAALAGVELIAAPSRVKLTADRDMLERALGNLVDNALRHAAAAKVLVGARRRGEGVRFWVIDDGVGVPVCERHRLFEDYEQGAGGSVHGGFGLGLGNVRRMAELMGGRAGMDAGWCRGAAFYIDVPLGGAEERAA